MYSFHVGQFLSNQGKYTQAADMFRTAIIHHPNDYELVFNLANALRQDKDGEQAEVYYRKAVEIQPDVSSIIGIIFIRIKSTIYVSKV